MKNKDWLWRAWRTFFQGTITYLVVAVPALIDSDVSVTRKTLIGIGTGAVCWGLGALMNIKMPDPKVTIPGNNVSETISELELMSTDDEPAQEIIETDEPVLFNEEVIEESVGEG